MRNKLFRALLSFVCLSGTLLSAADDLSLLQKVTILPEEVVTEQWPAMLDTISAPYGLEKVYPGQCIRFAVWAPRADLRDALSKTTLSIELRVGDGTKSFPAESPAAFKRVSGGVELIQAVRLRNREFKDPPGDKQVSISAKGWCAPNDARDEAAWVEATATTPDGKTMRTGKQKFQVVSFETAQRRRRFKDMNEVTGWIQHYHATPEPALLLPALRLVAADSQVRSMNNVMTFFAAALRASPAAAADLERHLPSEDHFTKMIGAAVLQWAAYSPVLNFVSDDERNQIAAHHLPDPYDRTIDIEIGSRQDQLWGVFFATGKPEPVRAIAKQLAWAGDYTRAREYSEELKTGKVKRPDDQHYPDFVVRGATYAAAGWSMSSLAHDDFLLCDYIDAMKVSPEMTEQVRNELTNLLKNPAFRSPNGK